MTESRSVIAATVVVRPSVAHVFAGRPPGQVPVQDEVYYVVASHSIHVLAHDITRLLYERAIL